MDSVGGPSPETERDTLSQIQAVVVERRHILGTQPERRRNRPAARLQMREIEQELKRLWQRRRAELRERTEPGGNG